MLDVIVGTGVDLIEVARIRRGLDRFGDRFLKHLFTPAEVAHCRRSRRPEVVAQRLAARFAAKEAVMKALGTGRRGVGWTEIEIRNNPAGKPEVWLMGRAAARLSAIGAGWIEISLTHTAETAIAFAVAVVGYRPVPGEDPS